MATQLHALLGIAGVEPPVRRRGPFLRRARGAVVLPGASLTGLEAWCSSTRRSRTSGCRMSRERRWRLRGGALFARTAGARSCRRCAVPAQSALGRRARRAPRRARTVRVHRHRRHHTPRRRSAEDASRDAASHPDALEPPQEFVSLAGHLAGLAASAADAAVVTALPDLPAAVVCAGGLRPDIQQEHERLATFSPNGRFVRASTTGHWVHLDDPRLVVGVIREVVEEVRRKRQGTGPLLPMQDTQS